MNPVSPTGPHPIIARLLAAGVALLIAHGSTAGEPPKTQTPPRRRPLESALFSQTKPRVKLAKHALQTTLQTILNGSLTLEKRISAIGLVGLAQDRRAVATLIQLLKRQDRVDVKVAAVWALREIADPVAIPALLEVHGQATGPHPRLRYTKKIAFPDTRSEMTFLELIEDAIGRLGEWVVDKYVKALSGPSGSYRSQAETTTNLQRAALAVIVCIGDRDHRALQALTGILKSPPEAYPPDFRVTAAYGLARILVARAREFEVIRARDKTSDQITELLVEFILTLKPSVPREFLISSLNIARPTYAVTLLTRHFGDNSPEKVRKRVIEMLGMLRSRESVEALIWALQNEKNPDLRWRAAFGLGLSGKSKPAINALTEALKDQSPDVKCAALNAIGRTGGAASVKLVGPHIRNADARIRAAAARALGFSRDKAAIAHLLPAAQDQSPAVRASVVASLAALPAAESLKTIVKAVADPERSVRFAALKILSSISNVSAYRALLRLADDSDRKVRADASNALRIARAHHPEKFKQAVILTMTDADDPASAIACDLADFPKDRAVLDALKKASLDKRPAVRASALRTLRNMGVN